ncbi:hypothetical protein QVD17_39562 [Tagetes erecta]|uniref:Uncharacterized protein n=1 Tax=Tagetes erecta TaxID=13708 RepID=A0AAD8JNS0_TARER|nr:hypothetical protein QVD17_39562 [Tagetes erecta]
MSQEKKWGYVGDKKSVQRNIVPEKCPVTGETRIKIVFAVFIWLEFARDDGSSADGSDGGRATTDNVYECGSGGGSDGGGYGVEEEDEIIILE